MMIRLIAILMTALRIPITIITIVAHFILYSIVIYINILADN